MSKKENLEEKVVPKDIGDAYLKLGSKSSTHRKWRGAKHRIILNTDKPAQIQAKLDGK